MVDANRKTALGPALMDKLHLTPEIEAVLALNPLLLVNFSGGKDSEVTLHQIDKLFGATHDIMCVWADTGAEYKDNPGHWPSSEAWTISRAGNYGYALKVVRHPKTTYLERVEAWGIFPDAMNRWCTGDFKTKQIEKVINASGHDYIISILGIRAAESPKRARQAPWKAIAHLNRKSNVTKRQRNVFQWYPLHQWPTDAIFAYCERHKLPLHPIYDWMPSKRFSCETCIFATDADLAAIRKYNYQAFAKIAALEIKINFNMRNGATVTKRADAWEAKQAAGLIVPEPQGQMCLF